MIVVDDIHKKQTGFSKTVVTIGSFDGVHLGHRRILETVVQEARRKEATPCVVTMRPHPRQYFLPGHAPNLLTNDGKKVALFEEAGIEATFFLPFDEHIARMERSAFVKNIIHGWCRATTVVVGHDFCFGRGAAGNSTYLAAVGPSYGFHIIEVPPVLVNGERVSSTLIREQILEGDLDAAALFLGRPYSIRGEVVQGRGIGGTLGFPTANIKPHHGVVPAQGVYAAEALLGDAQFPAAVNIGIAPTIRHENLTIEAYLLGFSGDVLGKEIEIVFWKRLRPERKFSSHDALIQQIRLDVAEVSKYYAEKTK
jgi:riboflavin kinase / FMN adenylyltransferase